MLILELDKVKKYFGDRLIFDIENLKVYKGDRIGVVGLNGAGKTTLLNVLSKRIEPDEGIVKLYGRSSYIKQLEESKDYSDIREIQSSVEAKITKEFGVHGILTGNISGGEKTRVKIVEALYSESETLFADEPTCNLDMKGINLLEQKLKEYEGAIIIVSHDRMVLDNLCNTILEVDDGKINIFPGNFSDYKKQKAKKLERHQFEYEAYIREKNKLEAAVVERKQKVKSMKKTPARMGNSEARLHTRAVNGKKGRIDRAVKAMVTRIDLLEKVEKPREMSKVSIDLQENLSPISKVILSCKDLNKSFESRKLFENVSFEVNNGSKVAIVGDNGSGKTTLINMILEGEAGIRLANGAKIGYFKQNIAMFNEEKSLLQNVMADTTYPGAFARTVLARLLFKRDDVYKKIKVLSGGERVKAAFARVFLSDVNFIILDEPTNYLDIQSGEALEKVLKDYGGTLLFVSHDRKFVEEVADYVVLLRDNTTVIVERNDEGHFEYLKKQISKSDEELKQELMILEMQLAAVNGRLCTGNANGAAEGLEKEYKEILEKLKEKRMLVRT
jgi:macrolide transport system ATP-binding/permease protein